MRNMSPSSKRQTAFRLDPDVLDGLQALKDRDGAPFNETVHRALRAWFEAKGVMPTKAARKRAATRKRA